MRLSIIVSVYHICLFFTRIKRIFSFGRRALPVLTCGEPNDCGRRSSRSRFHVSLWRGTGPRPTLKRGVSSFPVARGLSPAILSLSRTGSGDPALQRRGCRVSRRDLPVSILYFTLSGTGPRPTLKCRVSSLGPLGHLYVYRKTCLPPFSRSIRTLMEQDTRCSGTLRSYRP